MKLLSKQISLKDVLFFFIILILIASLLYVLVIKAKPETQYDSKVTFLNLKDVGRLVTQEGFYTSVQVIDGSRKLFGLEIPFTEKKYVYSYDGKVSAGIDFERIDQTIDEEAHTISVKLPAPEIFDVVTDESSFKVYHEGENPFHKLHIEETNEARIAMEKEIRDKAISNGILEHATENAKHLIMVFLNQTYDQNIWTVTIN